MSKIEYIFNADGSVKNILYTHFGSYFISEKEIEILKDDIKCLNLEIREFQKLYNIYNSQEELESEILFAQYKYMEGIQFTKKVKCPDFFNVIPTTHIKLIIDEDFNVIRTEMEEKKEDLDTTLDRLSIEGFKYYLYWRTQVMNYKPIDHVYDCARLLTDEMIINTIDNSPSMLSYLKTIFSYHDYSVRRYERDIKLIKNGINHYLKANAEHMDIGYGFFENYQMTQGNFSGYFEYFRNSTQYSLSTYLFKKFDLKDYYIELFYTNINKISNWINNKGYSFNDLFVAKKEKYCFFSFSNFDQFTINRIFGETSFFHYKRDNNSSTLRKLILICIENSLRKLINMKLLNETDSVISLCKKNELINETFVDELVSYIYDLIQAYVIENPVEIIQEIIKQNEENKKNNDSSIGVTQKNVKKNPKELFGDFVLEGAEFAELLECYKSFSPSVKKNNRNYFFNILFDKWILCKSEISYNDLVNELQYDKNSLISKESLIDLSNTVFIEYVTKQKIVYSKEISKVYSEEFVYTCLVLAYYLFYTKAKNLNLNPSDLLLGKIVHEDWNIFNDYFDISVNKILNNLKITKEVLNIEKYVVDIFNNINNSVIIRHSYSNGSCSIIKFINTLIQNLLIEHGLKLSKKVDLPSIDYEEFSEEERIKINELVNVYSSELNLLMKQIINYNKELSLDVLNEKLIKFPASNNFNESYKSVFEIFYGGDSLIYEKNILDQNSIMLDFNSKIEDYKYIEQRDKIQIRFKNYNLTAFYEKMNSHINKFDSIFDIDDEVNVDFDIFSSEIMKPKEINFQGFFNFIDIIEKNPYDFHQWILRIETGQIIVPKFKIYILLLYYYFINGYSISTKGYHWNLIVLIQLWNKEYENKKNIDEIGLFFLELIHDYTIAYCPEIGLDLLKSLLCYDITFGGESTHPMYIGKGEIIDKSLYYEDIMQFYNKSMNYKYLQTSAKKLPKGFTEKMVECLKAIEIPLENLWKKYDRSFIKDLLDAQITEKFISSILFKRIVLSNETQDFLNNISRINFKGYKNDIKVNYNYNINCFEKEICYYIVDYDNQYLLREYIFKLVEKSLRNFMKIPSSFLLDSSNLAERFNDNLYIDNLNSDIIANTINDTIASLYKNTINNSHVSSNQNGNVVIQNIRKDDEKNVKKERIIENLIKANELKLINQESIFNSRSILDSNQEKLVIDEDNEEPIVNETFNKYESEYSKEEIDFLYLLLKSNVNIKDKNYIKSMIRRINEKSLSLIDDLIIDTSTNKIYEEYIDYVEGEIGKWQ